MLSYQSLKWLDHENKRSAKKEERLGRRICSNKRHEQSRSFGLSLLISVIEGGGGVGESKF